MIEAHFGDGSRLDVSIRYVREEEPLGTAGALTRLPETLTAPFFLVNGDILTKCDFRGMLAFHERAGADLTVGTVPHTIDLPYGVVRDGGRPAHHGRGEAAPRLPDQRRHLRHRAGGAGRIPRDRVFDATDLIRLLKRTALSRGVSPSATTGSTSAASTTSTRPTATWPRGCLTSVGVVGLGYVGLTLAVSLARKGFIVHGVETAPRVLAALATGRPHLFEPGARRGPRAVARHAHPRGRRAAGGGVDAAIICVSTPVDAPPSGRARQSEAPRATSPSAAATTRWWSCAARCRSAHPRGRAARAGRALAGAAAGLRARAHDPGPGAARAGGAAAGGGRTRRGQRGGAIALFSRLARRVVRVSARSRRPSW